jgi:CHASE2 domain-containing sensor protein
MLPGSAKDRVRGNLIAIACMCFLLGIFFLSWVLKVAAQDYIWSIPYLLAAPLLIFAAVFNARRILNEIP